MVTDKEVFVVKEEDSVFKNSASRSRPGQCYSERSTVLLQAWVAGCLMLVRQRRESTFKAASTSTGAVEELPYLPDTLP